MAPAGTSVSLLTRRKTIGADAHAFSSAWETETQILLNPCSQLTEPGDAPTGFLGMGARRSRPGDKNWSGSPLSGRWAQGLLTGGKGRREVRQGREDSQ